MFISSGEVILGPALSACHTMCGVRTHVHRADKQVLKLPGNAMLVPGGGFQLIIDWQLTRVQFPYGVIPVKTMTKYNALKQEQQQTLVNCPCHFYLVTMGDNKKLNNQTETQSD